MNMIKKVILCSLVLSLSSVDIAAMDGGGRSSSHLNRSGESKTLLSPGSHFWNIYRLTYYITQLSSIYSVDSVNPKVIQGLACARTGYNSIGLCNAANRLYRVKDIPLGRNLITFQKALSLCFSAARIYNIFRDYNILKNAKALAADNVQRNQDQHLSQKKVVQAGWLLLNAVLPLIVNNLYLNYTLALSELLRQEFMYRMITNNKK